MKQVIRAMSAALVMALLVAAAWAYQDQPTQSLGDVAKQKSGKKAKKVYTEDDLPTSTGGVSVVGEASAPAAASSGASGTPGAAPGKEASGKPGATTAPDSEKAKEAKDRAETLAKDLQLYEERHKKFKARMDAETDPGRKEQMQRDLETMERNMGRVREQQAEAAAAAAGAPAQPKPAEPAQETPKQ